MLWSKLLIRYFLRECYNNLIEWMSKSEVCNYRDELKEIELRLQMEKVFLVDGNNYIMQNISVSRYKPGRRILTILKK